MKRINWKSLIIKLLPHLGAIAVMYLLTAVYFSPICFDNKMLPQGDMLNFKGVTKEVVEYEKETGITSGWTNSMFSGMPTEALYVKKPFNIFDTFNAKAERQFWQKI